MVRATSYPPCHDDLTDKALTYLKENRKKEYKSMTPAQGTEYAELAAKLPEAVCCHASKDGDMGIGSVEHGY